MQYIYNIYAIICKICRKYPVNMQNMHMSVYLHIMHIYTLC